MRDRQDRFWKNHYDDLATAAKPWLDYSNDRVQAQTFAVALEAAGSIQGRCCLDFGCGFGLLSMALEALGAAAVCGIDQSAVIINRNRQRTNSIEWILGQALDIHGQPVMTSSLQSRFSSTFHSKELRGTMGSHAPVGV